MDYHEKNDNTLDENMEVIKPEMERIQERFRKTAGSHIELGNNFSEILPSNNGETIRDLLLGWRKPKRLATNTEVTKKREKKVKARKPSFVEKNPNSDTSIMDITQRNERNQKEFIMKRENDLDLSDLFSENIDSNQQRGGSFDKKIHLDNGSSTLSKQKKSSAITSLSFGKKNSSIKWTEEENIIFYKALNKFGLDFSMIADFFSKQNRKRNRNQIKSKYHREEKENPEKIEDALRKTVLGSKMDMLEYSEKELADITGNTFIDVKMDDNTINLQEEDEIEGEEEEHQKKFSENFIQKVETQSRLE